MARTPNSPAAQSVDGAASGFIRHRFVLALRASVVVLIALIAIVLMGIAIVQNFGQGFGNGLAVTLVGLPILFIGLYLPVIFLTGFAGALIDVVHRRITALALLAGAGYFLWDSLWVLRGAGAYHLEHFFDAALDQRLGAVTLLYYVFRAVLSLECALQALWQLTVSDEGFLAARGWRPSPWRLLTTFRRSLGLAPFIANFGRGRTGLSLLYFIVALLNLGLMALLFLPLFAAPENGKVQHPATLLGLAALLLLNLFGAGRLVSRWADKRATKIYQGVRVWDQRAPIVFLRTFDQDRARLPAREGDPFAKWPAGVGRARTLDEILLEHGAPYGPVIAIGDPHDPTPPLGAARIFVPGEGLEWQEVVKGLVDASKAVVMCPNDSQGVQWELNLIAQSAELLCVIYMANPELPRATNIKLFEGLAPPDADAPLVRDKQTPIAAFVDPHKGWRVLTARKRSVEAYTVALNLALQARFGLEGVALEKRARG